MLEAFDLSKNFNCWIIYKSVRPKLEENAQQDAGDDSGKGNQEFLCLIRMLLGKVGRTISA